MHENRRIVLASALAVCAISMCLLPLAARSSLEMSEGTAASAGRFEHAPVRLRQTTTPPLVLRDPFIAEGEGPAHDLHAAMPSAVFVRAVITGSSPRALIEDGGRIRIVQPGDAVAGSTVRSLGVKGIVLENGIRLPLAAQSL
ncbi:MAG: hypothetical protein ABR508_05315 [Candidatus Baltobacteraceae bacterium]